MGHSQKTNASDPVNPIVWEILITYPENVREKLLDLRKLVYQSAAKEGVGRIQETLKWGEPSYVTKGGSTIRMDWKKSSPQHYALYFHCQTKLVDTFKELYRGVFTFEGNRAIVFDLADSVPVAELKHCIALALTYHSRKHLPLLGV